MTFHTIAVLSTVLFAGLVVILVAGLIEMHCRRKERHVAGPGVYCLKCGGHCKELNWEYRFAEDLRELGDD